MKLTKALGTIVLLCSMHAFAQAASHSVTLTWTETDSATVGISYNVYKGTGTACTGMAKLASVSTLAYTDTAVVLGGIYCYNVTAVLNGVESGYSNMVTAPVTKAAVPVVITVTAN